MPRRKRRGNERFRLKKDISYFNIFLKYVLHLKLVRNMSSKEYFKYKYEDFAYDSYITHVWQLRLYLELPLVRRDLTG
jgi:hypothetical protein